MQLALQVRQTGLPAESSMLLSVASTGPCGGSTFGGENIRGFCPVRKISVRGVFFGCKPFSRAVALPETANRQRAITQTPQGERFGGQGSSPSSIQFESRRHCSQSRNGQSLTCISQQNRRPSPGWYHSLTERCGPYTQRGRVLQVLNSLGCASRHTMAGASAASA